MISLLIIYFPNVFDISWLKSLMCVMNDLCDSFLNPDPAYLFSSACFRFNWLFFFQLLRCVYIF